MASGKFHNLLKNEDINILFISKSSKDVFKANILSDVSFLLYSDLLIASFFLQINIKFSFNFGVISSLSLITLNI